MGKEKAGHGRFSCNRELGWGGSQRACEREIGQGREKLEESEKAGRRVVPLSRVSRRLIITRR